MSPNNPNHCAMTTTFSFFATSILLAAVLLTGCSAGMEQDNANEIGDDLTAPMSDMSAIDVLHLVSPRINIPAPGQTIAAGYFTLMNHGSESVTLTRISAAGLDVQMHTTVLEGAGTTMRPLTSVTIAADEQTVFQPGGKHLMIRDLPTGVENLALNMEFADGSTLQTTFALIPMQQWMEGGQNPHQGH